MSAYVGAGYSFSNVDCSSHMFLMFHMDYTNTSLSEQCSLVLVLLIMTQCGQLPSNELPHDELLPAEQLLIVSSSLS